MCCSYYLLKSSCKVVTKDHSIPETQHIASHGDTIFCNHLAKLLQKIIASQKTNTSLGKPTHHMLPDPEIPDQKMLIRARNAFWRHERTIGIRGFRGLHDVATIFWERIFRITFQRGYYSIWATFICQVLRKMRSETFVRSSKIFVWGS
jgi:hypothetical protein